MSKEIVDVEKQSELESLVKEGLKLSDKIKLLEKEFSKIKRKLDEYPAGKYATEGNETVTISETPVVTDPDPFAVKKLLIERKIGPRFMECVKIHITSLKRYITDEELAALRTETGEVSRRYSFR